MQALRLLFPGVNQAAWEHFEIPEPPIREPVAGNPKEKEGEGTQPSGGPESGTGPGRRRPYERGPRP